MGVLKKFFFCEIIWWNINFDCAVKISRPWRYFVLVKKSWKSTLNVHLRVKRSVRDRSLKLYVRFKIKLKSKRNLKKQFNRKTFVFCCIIILQWKPTRAIEKFTGNLQHDCNNNSFRVLSNRIKKNKWNTFWNLGVWCSSWNLLVFVRTLINFIGSAIVRIVELYYLHC